MEMSTMNKIGLAKEEREGARIGDLAGVWL